MQVKIAAIETITPAADHTGQEGKFIGANGAVLASATAVPHAVILDGQPTTGKSTIARCAGGVPGTVKVKLHSSPGTIANGTRLILHTDGTVKQNTGTAARVVVAEACEAGAASELIEAILITPIEIAAT